jgi:hypothetical protein
MAMPAVLPTTIPFNPSAIFAGQNPEAVIGFGIDLENPELPAHPLDVNPCGLLVRFGPCSTTATSGAVGPETQAVIQVGSSATLALPAFSLRKFAIIRNLSTTETVWFGLDANVLPGTTVGVNRGTPLGPCEGVEFGIDDGYIGPIYLISLTGNPLASVLEA